MERIACNPFKKEMFNNQIWKRVAVALLAIVTVLVCSGSISAQQTEAGPPQVGEGSLLYHSGISGRYESIPLLHTDAAIDVRGLVASATVTQQYANSSTEPIEAVYIFPLPHDAADRAISK